MPGLGFYWVVASMAGGFYQIWAKGAYVPRERRVPFAALGRAKRAELLRLAASNQSTIVPNLSRLPADERLILSLPVTLYEDRSTKPLYPLVGHAIRKVVWRPRLSSGRKATISLVDRGTLLLTSRRVIFNSVKRRREFPLDQLTHCSSIRSGIALSTVRRDGVNYFRGIGATTINFDVIPRAGERAQGYEWKLRGEDVEYVLYLLRTASASPPS